MSNKIYIVRHGQDEDNANGVLNGHRDMPLTKIGQMQAEEIAQKIEGSGLTFDVILASPLKRAFSTAQAIAKKQNMEVEVEPLLIEREFGVMTGKPVSSIIEMCRPHVLETDHINYFLCPDGAETFQDLMERGGEMLEKLEGKYKNKRILLVTHGDMGKMIYTTYYDKKWEDVLKDFHFGNSEMLLLSDDSNDKHHVFKIKQYHKSK
ncbi:MAG: histidine phosphatase family protein [bacterium]|nr:histidine phosphatase family protein [bacterium]